MLSISSSVLLSAESNVSSFFSRALSSASFCFRYRASPFAQRSVSQSSRGNPEILILTPRSFADISSAWSLTSKKSSEPRSLIVWMLYLVPSKSMEQLVTGAKGFFSPSSCYLCSIIFLSSKIFSSFLLISMFSYKISRWQDTDRYGQNATSERYLLATKEWLPTGILPSPS